MAESLERQLVCQVKEGSQEAFRELVQMKMKQAYDLAYSFVNDHDDAEDITQESFVKAYQSMANFREDAEFGTWLYRIVTNTALDRLKQKKRKKNRTLSLDDSEVKTMAISHVNQDEMDLSIHIERALHELPTLQRAVVILRHYDGLSTRDVSKILQCSEGTVKTHLHRGLKKMRSTLNFLVEA
ncbi:MAG: RNA polymerase sigma factor [bacterium]